MAKNTGKTFTKWRTKLAADLLGAAFKLTLEETDTYIGGAAVFALYAGVGAASGAASDVAYDRRWAAQTACIGTRKGSTRRHTAGNRNPE